MENPSFAGFLTSNEITSGLLLEMAYMAHCMEGVYSKPALQFGNWCYQQAFRMLSSLSKYEFTGTRSVLACTVVVLSGYDQIIFLPL